MRRIVFTITMVVGCIFLSNKCFAQTEPLAGQSNAPQQEEKTIFSFKAEIGLTDEQENKIKALLFDGQTLMKSYRDQLNALGTELARMINSDEDVSLIKSKLTEISKIQVEVSCYNIEFARKIKGILSPEQLKKWEEIKKEHAKG